MEPMTDGSEGAIETVDTDQPSAARMYDYFLGGSHNFAADRSLAEQVLKVFPDAPLMAQANRSYLLRGVRYLHSQGVRQFLDLGSGIPSVGNVHDTATDSAVVYVDIDPVAVAHSETILAGNERAGIIQADVRHPDDVLGSPVTRELLDFDQPIGLLTVALLHFLPDADDPVGVLGAFRDALAAGSGLVLGHGTYDNRPDEMARAEAIYKNSANPVTSRTRAEVEPFLQGWDIVEPGLTWVVEWRPDWPDDVDGDPAWCGNYGAVGWKR
jgi:SAM-dependent methyltransferase